jgi:predicted nucleic acid-binding protein
MSLPRSPSRTTRLVLDSSAIINLLATERVLSVLGVWCPRTLVTDIVVSELEHGRKVGHSHAELLAGLIKDMHVEVVSLGDEGCRIFEELVVGPAVSTLDDGEAATIAYAAEHRLIPVIDERKATRICSERFSYLCPASTIDLLADATTEAVLGRAGLAEAVFRALQHARMRVLPHQLSRVLELIGPERARLCPSLPKGVRDDNDWSMTVKRTRSKLASVSGRPPLRRGRPDDGSNP